MTPPKSSSTHQTLTPNAFDVLLALADRDRHGYSILQEIHDRETGRRLNPGTLYRTLAQLLERGFVEELDRQPPDNESDERRRYYRMTSLGREVAAQQARQLALRVQLAQKRSLLEP